MRYLIRALLSCCCRRDSGGDLQFVTADDAGSQLDRTHRRVLAGLLRWNDRHGSGEGRDVVSRRTATTMDGRGVFLGHSQSVTAESRGVTVLILVLATGLWDYSKMVGGKDVAKSGEANDVMQSGNSTLLVCSLVHANIGLQTLPKWAANDGFLIYGVLS